MEEEKKYIEILLWGIRKIVASFKDEEPTYEILCNIISLCCNLLYTNSDDHENDEIERLIKESIKYGKYDGLIGRKKKKEFYKEEDFKP